MHASITMEIVGSTSGTVLVVFQIPDTSGTDVTIRTLFLTSQLECEGEADFDNLGR